MRGGTPGAVLAGCALLVTALVPAPAPAQDDLFLSDTLLDGEPATGPAEPLTARGVLVPAEEAVISSELAARIVALPFRDGEAFAAGDALVAFDCALFEARRDQASAMLQGARATLGNARQLQQMNSIGELEVTRARTDVLQAEAALAEAAVTVDRCTIAAPYDGRVVEAFVNAHEVATPGVELLAIVSTAPLEATLLVPSDWLVWLAPGQPFAFEIDETAAVLSGDVASIGARVDPVSQTVPLRVVLSQAEPGLIAGMSGTARFSRSAATDPDG